MVCRVWEPRRGLRCCHGAWQWSQSNGGSLCGLLDVRTGRRCCYAVLRVLRGTERGGVEDY